MSNRTRQGLISGSAASWQLRGMLDNCSWILKTSAAKGSETPSEVCNVRFVDCDTVAKNSFGFMMKRIMVVGTELSVTTSQLRLSHQVDHMEGQVPRVITNLTLAVTER